MKEESTLRGAWEAYEREREKYEKEKKKKEKEGVERIPYTGERGKKILIRASPLMLKLLREKEIELNWTKSEIVNYYFIQGCEKEDEEDKRALERIRKKREKLMQAYMED